MRNFREKKTKFMQRDLTSRRERAENGEKEKRKAKFGKGDVHNLTKEKARSKRARGRGCGRAKLPTVAIRSKWNGHVTRFTVFAAYGCAAGCAI